MIGAGNLSGAFLIFFAAVTVGLVALTGAMIALGLRFTGMPWRRAMIIGAVMPTIGAAAAWLMLMFHPPAAQNEPPTAIPHPVR